MYIYIYIYGSPPHMIDISTPSGQQSCQKLTPLRIILDCLVCFEAVLQAPGCQSGLIGPAPAACSSPAWPCPAWPDQKNKKKQRFQINLPRHKAQDLFQIFGFFNFFLFFWSGQAGPGQAGGGSSWDWAGLGPVTPGWDPQCRADTAPCPL